MSDALSRILRTLAQLVAGGAFTALFDQIVRDVPFAYVPYVSLIFTFLVTIAQNSIESSTGRKFLAARTPPPEGK